MNTFIRHKAVKNRQYIKTDKQTETDRQYTYSYTTIQKTHS